MGRRRPVVGAAEIVDSRPIPESRERQKHTAFSGKSSPLSRSTPGRTCGIDGAQLLKLVLRNCYAVGEQTHTILVKTDISIDSGIGVAGIIGIADGAAAFAGVEEILPFVRGQGVPAAVGSVAAVGDGECAPVALQGFPCHVAVSFGGVRRFRIADTILGSTRPVARSAHPAEEVDGDVIGTDGTITVDADIAGGPADEVPLMLSKRPAP